MSAEDRILSGLVLTIAATIGWSVIQVGHPPAAPPSPIEAFDTRISAIAEAIALAEGYYARGEHDGHSLPYMLNNPGALKKPAHGAAAMPTWKDTGLVVFPTKLAGWFALRHQVRLMLTGTSTIYDLSDTLRLVGEKYADGNVNWGPNVATLLRVPPDTTLFDLGSAGSQ
jgi:hypothetical protein